MIDGHNTEPAQVMHMGSIMEGMHLSHVRTCSESGSTEPNSRSDATAAMASPAQHLFEIPDHRHFEAPAAAGLEEGLPAVPSGHEHRSWQYDAMRYPSPPPPSPARFFSRNRDSGHPNGLGMLADERWLALQLATSAAGTDDGEEEQHMYAEGSMRDHTAVDGGGHFLDNEDAMQEEDNSAHRPGEHSHASRTLSKWEELLQTRPRDPMAFYWREMIHWCRARNRGEESEAGVKRGVQGGEEAMLEESVDLLNRLVKRCRCNDDGGAVDAGP